MKKLNKMNKTIFIITILVSILVSGCTSQTTTNENTYDGTDVYRLQIYTIVMNNYNEVDDLGDKLSQFFNSLMLAMEGIDSYNDKEALRGASKSLDTMISEHDRLVKSSNTSITKVKEYYDMDISNLLFFLDVYKKAINFYEISLEALYEYIESPTQQNYDKYINNLELALEQVNAISNQPSENYYLFLNEILNYMK